MIFINFLFVIIYSAYLIVSKECDESDIGKHLTSCNLNNKRDSNIYINF